MKKFKSGETEAPPYEVECTKTRKQECNKKKKSERKVKGRWFNTFAAPTAAALLVAK